MQYGGLPQRDALRVPLREELEDLAKVPGVDDEVRPAQYAPLRVHTDAPPGGRHYLGVAGVVHNDGGIRPGEAALLEHPPETLSLPVC